MLPLARSTSISHAWRPIASPFRALKRSVALQRSHMAKSKHKKATVPDESHLVLPAHADANAAATPIIDTHTHLLTTFSSYKHKYPAGKYDTVWDFVRGVYDGRHVQAIVDVWCEAPVQRAWKEVADSALSAEDRTTKWGGIAYWFVMGTSQRSSRLVE